MRFFVRQKADNTGYVEIADSGKLALTTYKFQ